MAMRAPSHRYLSIYLYFLSVVFKVFVFVFVCFVLFRRPPSPPPLYGGNPPPSSQMLLRVGREGSV